MLSYDLTKRAIRDLAAARDWYDQRDVSLGNRFLDEVLLAIRAARERPQSFPEVRTTVRGVRCKKYPYRIYFTVESDRIVILAVYHTARDPARWDDVIRDKKLVQN
jgi:toxin ParE1/3/4